MPFEFNNSFKYNPGWARPKLAAGDNASVEQPTQWRMPSDAEVMGLPPAPVYRKTKLCSRPDVPVVRGNGRRVDKLSTGAHDGQHRLWSVQSPSLTPEVLTPAECNVLAGRDTGEVPTRRRCSSSAPKVTCKCEVSLGPVEPETEQYAIIIKYAKHISLNILYYCNILND